MVRALLSCALVLSAAACSAPGPRLSDVSKVDLLSGAAFTPPPHAGAPESGDVVFALDDTMRAFVAEHTALTRDPAAKLRRLLSAMKNSGLFALEYDETLTRTARETFYERSGNCLSFTILFVALAREAGLNARYQTVDMPPGWSREDDLIVVTNHINALVTTESGQQFVVDFNIAGYQSDRPQRVVDDEYVLSLFYNNMGAEALIRKDYATSFRYLRAALTMAPDVPDPWVNLGVLYRRQGNIDYAEAAYLHALSGNPRDGSALTNLANLAEYLGDHAAAAEYRERIRRYQRRNPYYHYFLAREAFDEQRFDDAQASLRQAKRLKADEPAFEKLEAQLIAARVHAAGGTADRFVRSADELPAGTTP